MKIEFEASPQGRALIMAAFAVVISIAGIMANAPAISLAGICLATASLIAMWALRSRCNGHVKWTGTEDNEIQIANCTECDRWTLSVRGDYVAHGKGFPAFEEAVTRIATSYDRYLPHLSMRLRKVLDLIEANNSASKPESDRDQEEREGLESLLP